MAYTYDPAGRISETSGGEEWTFDCDAAGQLTSATGPTGNHSYAYDAVGNLVSKDGVTLTVDVANQLVSDSEGAAYTYDNTGRLVEVTEADCTVRAFEYDGRGLLGTVTFTTPGSGDPGGDVCVTATPTITGTEAVDDLIGTSGDDVIFGLGGNDIVCGGDSIDVIDGGSSPDMIREGRGNECGAGPDR